MSLRQRLPKIPIPLRETDADVMLDLQPLIEASTSRAATMTSITRGRATRRCRRRTPRGFRRCVSRALRDTSHRNRLRRRV